MTRATRILFRSTFQCVQDGVLLPREEAAELLHSILTHVGYSPGELKLAQVDQFVDADAADADHAVDAVLRPLGGGANALAGDLAGRFVASLRDEGLDLADALGSLVSRGVGAAFDDTVDRLAQRWAIRSGDWAAAEVDRAVAATRAARVVVSVDFIDRSSN